MNQLSTIHDFRDVSVNSATGSNLSYNRETRQRKRPKGENSNQRKFGHNATPL